MKKMMTVGMAGFILGTTLTVSAGTYKLIEIMK